MRAAFHTFGCKLNQSETESLAASFRCRGFEIVPSDQEAEIFIINTCTVTSKSEQKARRLIRKLSRDHPEALLIATGCYAQLNRNDLRELGANVEVLPQESKDLLLEFPEYAGKQAGSGQGLQEIFRSFTRQFAAMVGAIPGGMFRLQTSCFSFHSRAFLKIQDGCDSGCSYCRVPLARGGSVSLALDEVVERVRDLEKAGYREIVLTGVNISAYRCGEKDLPGLIKRILSETESVRFRLSSLEPETIDETLCTLLADSRICAHFHLPVQSGSNRILEAMRRRYRAERVVEAVACLRRIQPEAFIAADFITGFPGESDDDFQATKKLIERLGLSRLHVFPFSPRPGTAAAGMGRRVPERIRDERADVLLALSKTLYSDYAAKWLGCELEVLLENPLSGAAAWLGTSANYLKVAVDGVPERSARSGSLVRALIHMSGTTCAGRYLSSL